MPSDPSTLQIGNTVVIGGFFLNLVVSMLTAVVMMRSQKREVSLSTQYATKEEVQEVQKNVENLTTDMLENVANLHEKINTTSKELAASAREIQIATQSLSGVDSKIQNIWTELLKKVHGR